MNQPTTTRRDMLRLGTSATASAVGLAIVSGVVLPADAKAATLDTAAWDKALRDYRQADEASDHLWNTIEEAARKDATAYTRDQHEAIAMESDRLGNARGEAEDRLFAITAPHISALAIKLDLLFANGDRDPIPGFQQRVLADARRLAREA